MQFKQHMLLFQDQPETQAQQKYNTYSHSHVLSKAIPHRQYNMNVTAV